MIAAFALDDLRRLTDHLGRQAEVWAPQRAEQGWEFAPLTSGAEGELALCDEPSELPFSAKDFFFAERESLFVFDGRRFVETLPPPTPRVLFGLLACDAAAVAYQDQFFAEDAHYRARRSETLIVARDCGAACSNGLCVPLGTGPNVREGVADLVLQLDPDGGGELVLLVETPAGLSALDGLELRDTAVDWQARRRRGADEAEAQAVTREYLTTGIARLNAGDVRAETWEELGLRCIACTGCTTVCPTCSCYGTRDIPAAEGGFERQRFWDSCLLEGFQREASGHHPAPTAGMRLERFYRHKLGDEFVERLGQRTCVGCGRCEATCPGMVGIQSTLQRIAAR